MMKYLKAEAEIIKFDNSDVVTNSICQDNSSVTENCSGTSTSHATQSAGCTTPFTLWWVVRGIINLICGVYGWWFASGTASIDEFDAAGVSENDRDF